MADPALPAGLYVMQLYIVGSSPHSARAVSNIRRFCEEHLTGRYALEVVDLAENRGLAGSEQIVAAPTLVKRLPLPMRRFVGDMSRTGALLAGLDLAAGPAGK